MFVVMNDHSCPWNQEVCQQMNTGNVLFLCPMNGLRSCAGYCAGSIDTHTVEDADWEDAVQAELLTSVHNHVTARTFRPWGAFWGLYCISVFSFWFVSQFSYNNFEHCFMRRRRDFLALKGNFPVKESSQWGQISADVSDFGFLCTEKLQKGCV